MKITRSRVQNVMLGLGLLCLIAVHPAHAQTAAGGIITGTVQGPKGPEAGVWVIAETKDLLTGFIKIVVTDDRGRFLVPDLPAANYKVWVPRLRPGRFDAHRDEAQRHRDDAQSRRRQNSAGSRQSLSRQLLAVAAGAARENSLPRHRAHSARQRYRYQNADPEPLDQLAQIGLQFLPPARQPA